MTGTVIVPNTMLTVMVVGLGVSMAVGRALRVKVIALPGPIVPVVGATVNAPDGTPGVVIVAV